MSAVISMKMSASWEAEKSSANAVPRLCNLSLVQIILDRPLEPDSTNTGFFVVVRMAGSARRVLRSPEITLIPSKPVGQINGVNAPCTPSSGQPLPYATESSVGLMYPTCPTTATHAYPQGMTLTVPTTTTSVTGESASSGAGGCVYMDFNCSIQYSHMLNRDGNTLQILIQRRKKYKSKTMNLGYKTLAYCNVNLAQVLQRRIENRFLELYTDPKCSTHPVGRVEIQYLSTTPIEKDLMNGKRKVVDEDEDFPLPDMYSEDSDHGEESDEDQIAETEETGHRRQKKLAKAMSVGQKQIKQKLIGLLKKLKISDPSEEDLDVVDTSKLWDEIDLIATASDMEEEDSEADGTDSVSIHSTPKPTLRPFFATTGSSDDTLSADAGTKLLKRLQRELFARGEAETSSGAYYLRSVLPETSLSARPSRFSRGAKKGSTHVSCTTNTSGAVPNPAAPTFSTATMIGGPIRSGSSAMRHHRGNATGGTSSSGSRLASRLVHMRRRSNLVDSGKEHSVPIDVSKQVDCRYPGGIPVNSASLDGVVPASGSSPTNQDSSDEKSELNGPPIDSSSTVVVRHSHRCSVPTDVATLATSSVVDAAFSTASGRALSPGLPHASSAASPTLTSTPETNKTHGSFGARVQDGRESSFVILDDSQHEVDQFHPGSIDQVTNVLFLIHTIEPGWKDTADLFTERDLRLVPVSSYAEVKQTLARLASDAQNQKFRASDGDLIRVCLLGGDALVSLALRAYVDQLSSRSADLAAAFRFYVVPLPGCFSAVHTHSAPTQSVPSTTQAVPTSRHRNQACGTAARISFPARPLSEAVNSSFGSEAWSDTDNAGKTTSWFSWMGPPWDFNNMLASHLCRIDPTYSALFADCCTERPSLRNSSIQAEQLSRSTRPSEPSGTCPSVSRGEESSLVCGVDLFERVLIYLNNSRSVLPMPIGACLLGTAAGSSSATGPSKTHKTSVHANTEQPCSSLSTVVSATESAAAAPSGVTGLSEEMLIPFLLAVRLGVDPSQLPSFGPGGTPQSHGRSATGDPMMMMLVPGSHTADGCSVVSDPEASSGPSKRSMSPECNTQTAFSSPKSHSSAQQPLVHNTSAPLADSRFWDLQIEYWSVQPSACTQSSSGSGTNKPSSSTGGEQLMSGAVSTHTGSTEGSQPPRRCTMKVICRGLLITLAYPTTGVNRGGDYGNAGSEWTPSCPPTTRSSALVCSPGPTGTGQLHSLTLAIWTKEKKQKIMRIGRRGKEFGCKFDVVDGIQRLLCTGRGCLGGHVSGGSVERGRESDIAPVSSDVGSLALEAVPTSPSGKLPGTISALGLSIAAGASFSTSSSSSSSPASSMMQVFVDGVEWAGLKFFQITPSWRTQIKFFPLGTMGIGRADQPQSAGLVAPQTGVTIDGTR